MRAAGLQQAELRLQRARDALRTMEVANRFSDLDEAWSNFLVAAKLVFAKLGAGAKGDPESEGWYAAALGAQRADPLLRYLYQARNAEEHGLDRSLEHAYDIRVVPGVRLEVEATYESNGDVTFRNAQNPDEIVRFALRGALKPVTDRRSGYAFDPPVKHQGVPLQNTSVFGVADAAIAYLAGLIEAASQLPRRT